MKKDKEWLEKEINKTLNIDGGSGERIEGFNKGLEFSLDLIEELDQPEVPVIPQFVADWYEINKNIEIDYAFELIKSRAKSGKLDEFDNWVNKNKKMFALAFVAGYAIEKEPKYVVKINDQGSWLYLKSMQLYKDVESRTDLNSNFEAWKEKAIKFTNKEQAEGIAKFFNGEVVEVTENV